MPTTDHRRLAEPAAGPPTSHIGRWPAPPSPTALAGGCSGGGRRLAAVGGLVLLCWWCCCGSHWLPPLCRAACLNSHPLVAAPPEAVAPLPGGPGSILIASFGR